MTAVGLLKSIKARYMTFADAGRETKGVADWIKAAVAHGIAPAEIGIFVR